MSSALHNTRPDGVFERGIERFTFVASRSVTNFGLGERAWAPYVFSPGSGRGLDSLHGFRPANVSHAARSKQILSANPIRYDGLLRRKRNRRTVNTRKSREWAAPVNVCTRHTTTVPNRRFEVETAAANVTDRKGTRRFHVISFYIETRR